MSTDQHSGEQNVGLVRDFIERVWNRLAAAEAEHHLASDYIDHAYTPGTAEGLKKAIRELGQALPDQRSTIEDVVASGDHVAVRMVLRGTHLGEFRGHAPSGTAVEVKVFRWFRIEGGRIAEHWALLDTASLLRQISMPQPPSERTRIA